MQIEYEGRAPFNVLFLCGNKEIKDSAEPCNPFALRDTDRNVVLDVDVTGVSESSSKNITVLLRKIFEDYLGIYRGEAVGIDVEPADSPAVFTVLREFCFRALKEEKSGKLKPKKYLFPVQLKSAAERALSSAEELMQNIENTPGVSSRLVESVLRYGQIGYKKDLIANILELSEDKIELVLKKYQDY